MTLRAKEVARNAVIPGVVGRILENRGFSVEQAREFLYPVYERLHDPFLLSDMKPAVERILAAVKAGEQVVVYGDYDIDGITASAVMLEALAAVGVKARSYIPDRFEEGYGINQAALERLIGEGVTLVVSVDCGITSVNEAAWARKHGLDLIITDHHAVPEVIPVAVAVINPKRPDDQYPFKDLAGVGVAFKLAQALQQTAGKPAAGQEKWLLDLVALGTVCDVVTLVGENRTLVSFGLKVLRKTRRVGLRALAAVAGVDIRGITAYHLGYVLGPRMNAAGRLEHAAGSLELVMTADNVRATEIANELDELNRQRRATQETIFKAADAMAAQYADDPVLVLAHSDWSHGVVGIVASKLAEKWQKPTLVGQIRDLDIKGSARSVGSFNMVEALRANADLFAKFGGHFFAAGYTLPTERWDNLRQGLNDYWRQSGASNKSIEAKQHDIELVSLAELDENLLEELELLEPHGSGNPRPLWLLNGLTAGRIGVMGKEANHLRMQLTDAAGRSVAAVGFGLAAKHAGLLEGAQIAALGELNKNEYRGVTSIQVIINELQYEQN